MHVRETSRSARSLSDVHFPAIDCARQGVSHHVHLDTHFSAIDCARQGVSYDVKSDAYSTAIDCARQVVSHHVRSSTEGLDLASARSVGVVPSSVGGSAVVHSSDGRRSADSEVVLDDLVTVLSLLSVDRSVEKFDSGCSHCMTGNPSRHVDDSQPLTRPVKIMGFNSTGSAPSHVGLNHDGKREYYVSDMPEHLTLLLANAYCQDGCAVLFADGGVVLQMTVGELDELKTFLRSYPVQKVLRVNNRTYEIDPTYPTAPLAVEHAHVSETLEEALQGTASRFFNTKVNVSNQEERILTLLMTGLSFRDWQTHLKHGSLRGIPRDLTAHGLNQFEYRYGRTPDIVQLANPKSV